LPVSNFIDISLAKLDLQADGQTDSWSHEVLGRDKSSAENGSNKTGTRKYIESTLEGEIEYHYAENSIHIQNR
jgi:hypothetical protein